jgi:hypothetical protein
MPKVSLAAKSARGRSQLAEKIWFCGALVRIHCGTGLDWTRRTGCFSDAQLGSSGKFTCSFLPGLVERDLTGLCFQ